MDFPKFLSELLKGESTGQNVCCARASDAKLCFCGKLRRVAPPAGRPETLKTVLHRHPCAHQFAFLLLAFLCDCCRSGMILVLSCTLAMCSGMPCGGPNLCLHLILLFLILLLLLPHSSPDPIQCTTPAICFAPPSPCHPLPLRPSAEI